MNSATAIETWRQECDGWVRLFEFGASLYLHEPSAALLAEAGEVGKALQSHLPDQAFAQLFAGACEEELSLLRQEFFDLFFVPVAARYCPPYAAMQGGTSEDIWPLYRETGFQPTLLKGLPPYLRCLSRADYIGFELAFMASLLHSASQETDRKKREALLQTAGHFHTRHLAGWLLAFARQLKEKADSAYFKACAGLTAYLASSFGVPETDP